MAMVIISQNTPCGSPVAREETHYARKLSAVVALVLSSLFAPTSASSAEPARVPQRTMVLSCDDTGSQTEIRPENDVFNYTPGRATDPARFSGPESWRPYYERINGACVGSTETILAWAAQKWGFDGLGYADVAKAMAVAETWWKQGFSADGRQVGILQVHLDHWPDGEPARWSTAYAADYAMAVVRSHFDGASWLGDTTRGNLADAIAAWECGCAANGDGWYAKIVFGYLAAKPWQRAGSPPEWF